MTKVLRPYSRVYWEAIDDPKFVHIWDDDACLAWWLRLLVTADMAWPASATLPGVPRKVIDVLSKPVEGQAHPLVDLQGRGRFRIHGLDRERQSRGRRTQEEAPLPEPDGVPHGEGTGPDRDPERTPTGSHNRDMRAPAGVPSQESRDETRAETSRADTGSPPTPAQRGQDGDGDGMPGGTPRSNGTNPRAVAAREAQRRRDLANDLQMRYLRGELTADQHRQARADAGLPS